VLSRPCGSRRKLPEAFGTFAAAVAIFPKRSGHLRQPPQTSGSVRDICGSRRKLQFIHFTFIIIHVTQQVIIHV
jgi:hypothetical protein